MVDFRPTLSVSMLQKQTMQMIPQIIQSVEILQLPLQALQERIDQELTENPVLEVADTAETDERPPATAEPEGVPDQSTPPSDKIGNFEDSDEFRNVERMAEDYPEVFDAESYTGKSYSAGDKDRKLDAMQNTPQGDESLQDYLYHQFCLNEVTDRQKMLAGNIIYNIDNSGYLQCSLDELSRSMDEPAPVEELEAVLKMVQTLDPPGVGARSLKECLMIQAAAEMGPDSLEARLICDHLDDLAHENLPKIAQAMGISADEVKRLVESIGHLNPHPGAGFAPAAVPYVRPDVIVEKAGANFEVRLADDSIPRLYVSDAYKHILRRRGAETPATKEYLRGKIQSARWLIDAIEQRRTTLLKVARTIVQHQLEFLENGPEALRPLRMKTLAQEIGIHVATVSRAVANKYMETPQGVFAMRTFFPGGYTAADGKEVSDSAVQRAVAECIAAEDKHDPLSDEAVVEKLLQQGITIARRTVTKYRKILNIPSSRQRKAK